jgi:hypothetical protein
MAAGVVADTHFGAVGNQPIEVAAVGGAQEDGGEQGNPRRGWACRKAEMAGWSKRRPLYLMKALSRPTSWFTRARWCSGVAPPLMCSKAMRDNPPGAVPTGAGLPWDQGRRWRPGFPAGGADAAPGPR